MKNDENIKFKTKNEKVIKHVNLNFPSLKWFCGFSKSLLTNILIQTAKRFMPSRWIPQSKIMFFMSRNKINKLEFLKIFFQCCEKPISIKDVQQNKLPKFSTFGKINGLLLLRLLAQNGVLMSRKIHIWPVDVRENIAGKDMKISYNAISTDVKLKKNDKIAPAIFYHKMSREAYSPYNEQLMYV